MDRNTSIVVMNAVGMLISLVLIFGTAYLVVNYSVWWVLLLLFVGGVKFPSSVSIR